MPWSRQRILPDRKLYLGVVDSDADELTKQKMDENQLTRLNSESCRQKFIYFVTF